MAKIIQSRLIRWMLLSGCFFLAIMSLLRLVFHLLFKPASENGFLSSFWMGFRYDARVVCIFLLIVLLGGIAYLFRPFASKVSKRVLLIYSRLFGILIIFFYTFDFGNFAYLRQRMNASLLSYAEEGAISARMLWETYPVIKIMIGWILAFLFIFYATRYIYKLAGKAPEFAPKRNRVITYFVSFLLFGIAIFGRVSKFPLRWSDAYRLNSDYKASLALNPFQSFVSSIKFRGSSYDEASARKYYGLIAKELGVEQPDSTNLNYLRGNKVNDSIPTGQPNIVLVICESFSAYKSSMWGNPLNTTPYFNELCKQGVFYKNCFSPAYGTARGVWALITGIPDVTDFKTASRNPNLVDQHTILNDIKGYEKYYFIGGSASWANIRGVLTGNIKDLHLYEQEDYHSPAVDVWGISDKDLFMEANEVIKKQANPFFAIIQTADNHRPYTIPKEDRPFIKLSNYPKDTLSKYGFWTNEELNAYTYMDYTYKVFIEAARKEKYFDNTIFVFVGDHGIRGVAADMFPKVWTEQSLTLWHVPLLFYAPSRLQPAVVERKVSQVDIMPSIASLANLPVNNTTLGRNIFAIPSISDSTSHNHAFVFDFDKSLIGLVGNKYYYEYDLKTKQEGVYSLFNNNPAAKEEAGETLVSEMRNLAFGYYETSRFMLFHNKKKK
ncbi:MAG: sulfatase-like hydrolase/transferase [Chitinophagaceae bacterium]|nr:sulfatase-like hydrolase/transferase [Chitinophagaceae bacterium]